MGKEEKEVDERVGGGGGVGDEGGGGFGNSGTHLASAGSVVPAGDWIETDGGDKSPSGRRRQRGPEAIAGK